MSIHPKEIESELERIWKSIEGMNKMRSCLFNLIVCAKRDQREEYLHTIVQKVIEKFPSRIFFITYGESEQKGDLHVKASVMTGGIGEQEIVCDLIEIEVPSRDHPRVIFVLLPHILPDLPVYLLHADDPSLQNPIAERITPLVDRIIFDSEVTTDLPAFATAVLEARKRVDVADLNWARTEGWRNLFADVFKSKEDLEMLHQASSIYIQYNSLPSTSLCHTNIQSIYLQAWIACQLDWKLKTIAKDKNFLSFSYETVNICLQPMEMEDLPPGRIISIEIETKIKDHFVFKRNPACINHIVIEKSNPQLCLIPLTFVLEKDVLGYSFVKEIYHKGTSEHYMRMLTLLSTIKKNCLC